MIRALLQLCGLKIEDALNVVSVAVQFRNMSALGWILLCAIALAGLTWWTYTRRSADFTVSSARKQTLASLRFALFLLILLILLRPVFSFTLENNIRRMLLVLIDTSSSMNIQDPRTSEADVKRAERFIHSGNPKQVSRMDLVKAALQDPKLDLLKDLEKNFDLTVFGFGQNVIELSREKSQPSGGGAQWVRDLSAASPQTAIGDALRDVLSRKRGQPLAGVFLVTDGANNTGLQPNEAAALAKGEGVPLDIYGVGITSPLDISVSSLFTQDVAFKDDNLPVTVRVRGQGMAGKNARLTLKLAGATVAEKELNFSDESEQAVPLNFTPAKAGEFELSASIAPREDETVKDNNAVSQRLRVIDSKIKALVIEQTPRWEFRYLQNNLLRDRRVELKCVLLDADPSVAGGPDTPYLRQIPATKEELFKYDIVILGDVDPKVFSPQQFEALGEFVSKFGGSLISIAGRRFNPDAYKGTVIEKLLPVELDTLGAAEDATRETPLALTASGRTDAMLKLTSDEQGNAALWKSLPPIYWMNDVARAKPAAQVLVEDPSRSVHRGDSRMPVIALQRFGLGQVLYIGTDNTWRWRKNEGEKYHTTLWSQITQRMALAHLLGGAKRTQLTTDKKRYSTGERATIYARLYTEKYEPVREQSVRGAVKVESAGMGAQKQDIELRAVPDQPGMFRGDFVSITPGTHRFSVESDPATVVEFDVAEAKFELGETAMNEPLLKAMADMSGGAFFREDNLDQLVSKLTQKTESVRSTVDADIWSSPFYFALLASVATAEWVLRKRSQLK